MNGFVEFTQTLFGEHYICSKKDYEVVRLITRLPVRIRKWKRKPELIPDIRDIINAPTKLFELLPKVKPQSEYNFRSIIK